MSDPTLLVNEIKKATDYQVNKRILREKIMTDLHFTYNSGLFKATPEMLAFIATCKADVIHLEDTYQNPIEIKCEEFYTLAFEHYQKVMNQWHQQHHELKKIRKV